jgi:peptidoglycan/xylan/chitin deacetylase (PgdA/CDA1 family)
MIILKKAILKFINLFFYYSGFYYILKFINKKKVRILMYHGVGNLQTDFNIDDPSLIISPQNFEKQIKYLSKYYNIISLSSLCNCIEKKIPFPPNSVILTFDDGLKNNFTDAFPILQKYNITATFFLITDYIDTLKVSWDNKFFYFSSKIDSIKLIEEFKSKFKEYPGLIESIDQKNAIEHVRLILKYKFDENIREEFVNELYKKYRIKIHSEEIKDLYLSWQEIKIMADSGISFGSHTCTHPVLSRLNLEKIKHEIVSSKINIEDKLGKIINLFAYPFGYKGSFDLNAIKVLTESNFLCAVSTMHGFNDLHSNLYELRRICIIDEPSYYFKLRIEGFENFIEKIYQKIYRYFKKDIFLPYPKKP